MVGHGGVQIHPKSNHQPNKVTLAPGEQIDIEPGGWVYKDRTVQMQTMFQKLSTGLFASAGQICWNRFTGQGRSLCSPCIATWKAATREARVQGGLSQ